MFLQHSVHGSLQCLYQPYQVSISAKFYQFPHPFYKWAAFGGSMTAQGSCWGNVFKKATEERLACCEHYALVLFHLFSSLYSLETGLLYAFLLSVPAFLPFFHDLDPYASLQIGLTDPSGIEIDNPYQSLAGVMYQLCGIFSVRMALTFLHWS
jgi:hypothetical protein